MLHRTFYGEEIVPQKHVYNIRSYQYRGKNTSILYQYVHSPIAQFMVDKVFPPTLA